jgi:hypothetical protein
MIEKSAEGKEVLDNLFLEVSLEGKDININNVKARINGIEATVRRFRKNALAHAKKESNACRANLKSAAGRAHDFTARAVWARRTLAHVRRAQQKRGLLLERSSEQFKIYTRFRDMTNESGKAWNHFWAVGTQNYRKVAALISQVRAHVRKLHRKHSEVALIELPTTYADAMTEISSQFDSTMDNLGGLRPVISNLLEIVRSPVHLNRKQARRVIRRILRRLAYKLHDTVHRFAEENEHQKGIYHALNALFEDSRQRQAKLIKHVGAAAKQYSKKLLALNNSVKASTQFAAHARNIVDLLRHECRNAKHLRRKVRTESARILNHVLQVQEVIADRWTSLKSYFIERMEKQEEREQ